MKILKSLLCMALSLLLLLSSALYFVAYASTANLSYLERGILTDGNYTAYYIVDKDNRTLYITGDGENLGYTPDYPSANEGPFSGRTDITRIVIEGDVARVGDYVCANLKSADTLEIQSNLLSSNNSMSSKAVIGCTGLRNIQADSSLISTNILLEVIKGALNIASANWLSLVSNGIKVVSTGVNGDGSMDDDTVHAIVDDYKYSGEEIYLGEMSALVEAHEERETNPCYNQSAYHHSYNAYVSKSATCTAFGTHRYHCPNCGDEYYADDIEPLGHSYESIVFVQPKCVEEGVMKNHCTRCSNNTYTAIAPTGHLNGHWVVSEMAVPGRRGTLKKLCDECLTEMKSTTFTIPNSVVRNYKVGISVGNNTADSVKASLAADGYVFYIAKGNIELNGNALVGTGAVINTIRPEASLVNRISTVVLYGDVNGDGLVNASDKNVMKDYAFLDGNSIESGSVYEKAADLNGDGAVDAFDLFLCDGIVTGERDFDQTVDYVN